MGLAKHKKLSKSEYDSLSVKDEDTLYAVNQNGDFSEENLEDSAELYIGDKKITPTIVGSTGQSTTSVMHQKAVTDAINGLQSEIESKSEGFYGECNISPSTVAKTVTTLNGGFVLKKGAKVSVKFLQGHTASTMTLNVDGTGAKNVLRDGLNPTSTMIKSYNVYDFVYDGTYWRIVGVDTDTTYSIATQSANGLMSSADKKKLDSMATRAGYEAYLQWGGRNIIDGYSPIDASMIPILGSNRFNCYPVDKINIEYSRDKGATWVNYGATEAEKQALFKEDSNAEIQVGGKGATPSIDNMVRITIDTASTLYAILHKFIIYVTNNSGGGDCHVTISGRTQQNYENDNDTWVAFAEKAEVSGWNVINVNPFYTYGNTKTTQYGQIRFTFGLDSLPTSQNIGLRVLKMSAYGQAYTAPNTLAWYSRPFTYNYDGSMVLPKGLEIKGGDIRLANFYYAKIHGFPNSVANGDYSSAIGYNSFAGVRTGDTAYPYAYMTNVSPLPFTIIDDTLYGVSLAKNDSTTYTYNGNDYTVTNPSGSYAASVFLVQDSDGLLAKGTSYPMNICVVAKSAVTIGNGRIISAKNITEDIWELIINQQNNTINSYVSSLNLYLLKKTNSSNYVGSSSVASGSYSVASGYYSVASGSSSVASGYSSVASGSYSVASGHSSVASGYSSVASGYSSVASGYYSVALNARTDAKGDYQTVVGVYNADDNNAYFIVGNGTSDTARSNAMTVSKTGVVTANAFKGALQGNADSATKVNNAITINHNGTTKTYDGSSAVTIDIASGGSSSGESSIQPFAGFMRGTDMGNIVNQSTTLTGGQVYCSQSKNRFYYKVNGLFYSNFQNASLYNDNYDTSSATAKNGAIFSYNGKHYTMYNGTLQDMSVLDDNGNMTTAGIVKLSDEYSGSALNYGVYSGIASTPKAVSTAFSTMKTYVDNKATQSNQYTDTQIDAKIQLVTALPAEPTSGVLYLIAES